MKNLSLLLSLITLLFSCNSKSDTKGLEIIKKSVEAHGGDNYNKMNVSFDFRKFNIGIKLDGPNYLFTRISKDSLNNEIKDVLSNANFERFVNGKPQKLSTKDFEKYKEGTNSVAYFALLPYKLLDQAVIAEYLDTVRIEGVLLEKVSVKFKTEGGGKDHDDVFCYWFNKDTHTLDYLAYDNGGPRFRKAYNRQKSGEILFQDYENYEILDSSITTSEYDKAFLNGKAKLLSKIEQTNFKSLK